jgi:hypothetical protein
MIGVMTDEELSEYCPSSSDWYRGLSVLGDGYDQMEWLSQKADPRWHVVSLWGKHGWDMGEWPYVAFYIRRRPKPVENTPLHEWQVLNVVEGDNTLWTFPTEELRRSALDRMALNHWLWRNKRVLREVLRQQDADDATIWNIASNWAPDEVPDILRGPYDATVKV